MGIRKAPLRLLAILGAAEAISYRIVLSHPPLWLASAAGIVIAVVIPGALLAWLLLGPSASPPTPLEWIVYAAACGVTQLTVLVLALSYLPGGLDLWQMQVAVGVIALLLAVGVFLRRTAHPSASTLLFADGQLSRSLWRRVAAGLLIVGTLAGFFRFAHIGYAEFHGDEARAVLRAAAVIQGDGDVLFLHRKPPGEILLPTAAFAFTGEMNEAAARFPFALANMTALLGVLLLGWRMRGPIMGWAALLTVSLDGYLVAFARFVQYQSIVLLLSVAAVLVFHRLYKDPHALRQYMVVGALFLAVALLYHWDGLLAYLPAALLLAAAYLEGRVTWAALWRAALPAALIAAAVLALYFVPFMLHPQATATQDYVVQGRLLGQNAGLRNNIGDLVDRTLVYNSVYFIAWLVGLITIAILLAWHKGWGLRTALVLGPILLAIAAMTLWRRQGLIIFGIDLTFVSVVVVVGGIWIAPRLPTDERVLWLWFGAPLLASLFVVATPRTHVHIFLVPAALLSGMALERFRLAAHSGPRAWRALAPASLAGVTVLILSAGWLYLAFVDTKSEMVLNWDTQKPATYWTPAGSATIDRLYGFPMNNGWKVAGALYEQGAISGTYDVLTGADWISAWYTRGATRCLSSSNWYFAIRGLEPWVETPESAADRISAYGFSVLGRAQVQGRDAMTIYGRPALIAGFTDSLDLASDESSFDAAATPYLRLAFPVIAPAPATAANARFGDEIALDGVDLDYPVPLHPGDTFTLALHWSAARHVTVDYKVTNQMYDAAGNFAAQKDAMPVCDRLPTSQWLAGESVIDTHSITLDLAAKPGIYPLYTALYNGATGERLPVLAAPGAQVDDKLKIAELEIVAR